MSWTCGLKFRALLVATAITVAAPAMAEVTFPVTVPQECVEVGQREGVSVVLNSKYEATKAKLKLARLRGCASCTRHELKCETYSDPTARW